MMCNYRFGDALLFLALFSAFVGKLYSEAYLLKSWEHLIVAVFLCLSFVVASITNRRSRAADELRAHREMQQRMLGNPGDIV